MQYHDLLTMFRKLRADLPPSGVSLSRFTAGHDDLELIFLDSDRFWEEREGVGFSLLVLDGVGSIEVDDWRSSLSGGHFLPVPPDARVRVTADAGMPVALLAWRPTDVTRQVLIPTSDDKPLAPSREDD